MSNIEALKKEIATPKTATLQSIIESSAKELGRALPSHLNPQRLVRIALTNIRLNPALASCTPESFLGALFTLAQLGLEPVAGRAYLLPFKNNRKIGNEWKSTLEVQAIIGYRGLVDLFYRHEKAVMLTWGVVHEGDDFQYQKGTGQFLHHTPAQKKRGEIMGYWVAAKLQNGGEPFEYMTKDECMAHGAKHSKTYDKNGGKFYDSSPWAKEPEAMCLKTVLIRLAKLLPLSMELQQAIANDETSRDFRRGVSDVLDIAPTTNWEETTAEKSYESGDPDEAESAPEKPKVSEAVTEVFGKKAEKAADGVRYISDGQRKRFYAIWKGAGKDETLVKDYLVDAIGTDDSSQIPTAKYEAICKWAEAA